MPMHERIPADAEPPVEDTEKDLAAAIKVKQKELAKWQKTRWDLRQVRDRKGLAGTDAEFEACLTELKGLQKRYGRLVGNATGPGQVVAVETATERSTA